LFESIGDTITTRWGNAVNTTGVGEDVTVQSSVIALLVSVNNTITTSGQFAVKSAGIRGSVAVQSTVIALLEAVSEVGFIVTAFPQANGRATVEVVSVPIIALLARVDDAITAGWEAAGGSANTRDILVSCTKIACLSEVDNTITAFGQLAVGTAAVG